MSRLLFLFFFTFFSLSIEANASIDEELEYLIKINGISSDLASNKIKELENRWSEFETDDQRAEFYLQKGYFHLLRSDFSEARAVLEKALALSSISADNKVVAYNFLSQIAKGENDYLESFEYLFKALEIIPELKEPKQKIAFYHSSSNTLIQMGFWNEALTYSKIALDISEESNIEISKCYLQAQIYEIHNKMGIAQGLAKNIEKVINECEEHDISLLLANLYRSLGNNHLYTGDLGSAYTALELSRDYLKENPYQPERMELFYSLASLYFQQGDIQKSEYYIKMILDSEKNDWSYLEYEIYELLSKLEEKKGSAASANKYLLDAYEAKIERFEERNRLGLIYQKVKYSNLESEAQIKILDQENELLKLNSEVQAQSKRIYQLFSVITALLVALITLMFLRTKKLKERYQELSRKDGLTGVLSRRYALKIAKDVHSKSIANDHKYSLVVFDLDYFKSINDRYGHAIGDWVLKQVTEKVSSQIRKVDAFGRLGGEEFILVLPDTESQEAKMLAERCLEAIKTIQHDVFDDHYVVTASFGVATYPEFKDLEALIQNADDAMYKAKQMGRNQIFSFAQ